MVSYCCSHSLASSGLYSAQQPRLYNEALVLPSACYDPQISTAAKSLRSEAQASAGRPRNVADIEKQQDPKVVIPGESLAWLGWDGWGGVPEPQRCMAKGKIAPWHFPSPEFQIVGAVLGLFPARAVR